MSFLPGPLGSYSTLIVINCGRLKALKADVLRIHAVNPAVRGTFPRRLEFATRITVPYSVGEKFPVCVLFLWLLFRGSRTNSQRPSLRFWCSALSIIISHVYGAPAGWITWRSNNMRRWRYVRSVVVPLVTADDSLIISSSVMMFGYLLDSRNIGTRYALIATYCVYSMYVSQKRSQPISIIFGTVYIILKVWYGTVEFIILKKLNIGKYRARQKISPMKNFAIFSRTIERYDIKLYSYPFNYSKIWKVC